MVEINNKTGKCNVVLFFPLTVYLCFKALQLYGETISKKKEVVGQNAAFHNIVLINYPF